MKKQLLFALTLVLAGFTQSEAAIRETISGSVSISDTNSTFNRNLSDGDTLWIGSSSDTLFIDANNSTYASTNLVIYIVDSGVVYWTANYSWNLGANTKLVMGNGGDLAAPSPCNANKMFKLGTSNIASCSGGNATYSFRDIMDFGGYDPANPPQVPVELMHFGHKVLSADLSSSVVELNWQTASELNNDRFEVYRSVDGEDFDLVQVVAGAGTSSNINTYSIIDKAGHINKTLFYKLVQIDFDGASETFKVLSVRLSNLEDQVSIYPNPAQDEVEFRITNPSDESTEITITNLNGEVVLTETVKSSVRLNVSELRTGLYFLRATSNNTEVVNRKLIIN
jgi:hypothetical protein